jgi:hypothetical protein
MQQDFPNQIVTKLISFWLFTWYGFTQMRHKVCWQRISRGTRLAFLCNAVKLLKIFLSFFQVKIFWQVTYLRS